MTRSPFVIRRAHQLVLLAVRHRQRAQPRQNQVSHGWYPTGNPQPGGARREAELHDEVPSGGRDVADDHVRAERPDGAHPRDDSGEWVAGPHEERLHPAREAQVGPARHDGVCDFEINERSCRRRSVPVPARRVDEEDAWRDFAGQGVARGGGGAVQDWDLRRFVSPGQDGRAMPSYLRWCVHGFAAAVRRKGR